MDIGIIEWNFIVVLYNFRNQQNTLHKKQNLIYLGHSEGKFNFAGSKTEKSIITKNNQLQF